VTLIKRAIASASRRLQRPELAASFYAGARQLLHEEIAVEAVLAAVLRRDATYIDVGSNRGQLLDAALRAAPDGRHLAFEPIPELAAELRGAFPQVESREVALSARPGRTEFCHFRTMDGWSGLRRSPVVSDARGAPQYIEVQVSTLDLELADLTPDVIKIDVEGAELDVLRGGRGVLARSKPFVIFEHVAAAAALYDSSPGAIWDSLRDLDYEIFTVTGAGPFARDAFVASASGSVVNWFARPPR
jgi:FkbM family methyltransferase